MKIPLIFSIQPTAFVALATLWSGGTSLHAATAEPTERMPEAVPLSRYQAMIDKSPFAPATAAPAPVVEAPSFAKDFYITGMAQFGSKPFVTVSSRDNQKRFSLVEGQSFEGMTLTSVEWAPEVGKSKITLKKGSEFGVIGFDEAAMQPAAAPVPQPQQIQAQGPFPGGGRGGGNFGYGDRQRRRPRMEGEGGSEAWQERRRAWIEANQQRAGAQGRNGQPQAHPGQQGQQGQQQAGSQWRRRPATIPGGPQ